MALSASSLRPPANTVAPRSMQAATIAWPMPPLAPVTSTEALCKTVLGKADIVFLQNEFGLGHRAHINNVIGIQHHIEHIF